MQTNTPTTIAAAFAAWLEAERAAYAAADPEAMEPHLARAHQLEGLAMTLPTETAADVWALIRMTCEPPTEATTITADLLAARAVVECQA